MGLFLFIFLLFTNAMSNIAQFEYVTLNDKSADGVLEPGAAEWKARMNPLSYGGTNVFNVVLNQLLHSATNVKRKTKK